MKATINGITYEGTYEEITAIVDRMTPKIEHNPDIPYKELIKETEQQLIERLKELMRTGSGQSDWMRYQPKITCHNVQCFCDGSCMRPQGMSGLTKSFAILDQTYDRSKAY